MLDSVLTGKMIDQKSPYCLYPVLECLPKGQALDKVPEIKEVKIGTSFKPQTQASKAADAKYLKGFLQKWYKYLKC